MRLLGVSGQVIESDRCLYEPGGLLDRPSTRPGCGSRWARARWDRFVAYGMARRGVPICAGANDGAIRGWRRRIRHGPAAGRASIHSTPTNAAHDKLPYREPAACFSSTQHSLPQIIAALLHSPCKIIQSSLIRLLMSLAPLDLASPQEKSLTYDAGAHCCCQSSAPTLLCSTAAALLDCGRGCTVARRPHKTAVTTYTQWVGCYARPGV